MNIFVKHTIHIVYYCYVGTTTFTRMTETTIKMKIATPGDKVMEEGECKLCKVFVRKKMINLILILVLYVYSH